jgi:hypothetical protein
MTSLAITSVLRFIYKTIEGLKRGPWFKCRPQVPTTILTALHGNPEETVLSMKPST